MQVCRRQQHSRTTDLAIGGGGDDHVTDVQRAGLHQQRGDRAAPPIEVRLQKGLNCWKLVAQEASYK
jgi:hypothetical protein